MKKIFLFILLFCSIKSFGQGVFPINSTNGTPTTTNLTRGIAASDSGYWYRTAFADTTALNLGRIDEIAGVLVRTSDNSLWLRNATATKWIQISGGSGSIVAANNGLTLSGSTVQLRGTLNQNTTISGANTYYSAFDGVASFRVEARDGVGIGDFLVYPDSVTLNPKTTNHFRINSSEKMIMTSTGVGIGTTSPSTSLHIAGTGGLRYSGVGEAAGYVLTSNATGVGSWASATGLVNVNRGIIKNTDSVQFITYYPTSRFAYNDQSSYVTNLAWVQQTATYAPVWTDGSLSFYINDTLFLVGGLDGSTNVTDSIHYSTDLGITWGNYSKKFPYAFANVTSVKARFPGDWNYVFGITGTSNTNKRTVTRFKDFTQFFTMTTTAEFGNQYLYGVDTDDDGNLYLVGGQTDNQDTTTVTLQMWYSTGQSGGATWTQIQTLPSYFGGVLINQVRYRDGYLYVLNAGNKMNSSGVSAYSSANYKIPITKASNASSWIRIENSPSSVANQLFVSTCVFKGMIWMGWGATVGGNQNGVAYLDRYDKWHTYYSYFGIDSVTALGTGHAADFIVARGSLIKTLGNSTQAVYRLSDTTFSTPGVFRQYVNIANHVSDGETLNNQDAVRGSSVSASTTADNMIVRTSTEAYCPYYIQRLTSHNWGGLTTGNSTLNVNTAVTTGLQMSLDASGMLTIGLASSTAGTRLYNYGNAYFDGNNTNAAISWSHNGGTATGVITGVASQAWVGGASGSDLRLFANNGTPNVVLTTTGLYVGGNSTATNVLHVNGTPRIVTGAEGDGKLLQSSSTGVGDWATTFTGQYTIGSSGSAAGPRLIVWAGAQFLGNNIGPSLTWGQTTTLGLLTYSGSDAWLGGTTGAKLKMFVNNGNPNAVLTTLGLRIGDNNDADSTLTVIGSARISSNVLLGSLAGTGSRAVLAAADGTLSAPVSDERLKIGMKPIAKSVDVIAMLHNPNIRGIFYNWKDTKRFGNNTEIGFVAQMFSDVPGMTGTMTESGEMYLNYERITAILWEQNRILLERIEALEKKLKKQK